MFIEDAMRYTALRQEGHVYRRRDEIRPPSVRRAMSAGAINILYSSLENSNTYLGS